MAAEEGFKETLRGRIAFHQFAFESPTPLISCLFADFTPTEKKQLDELKLKLNERLKHTPP